MFTAAPWQQTFQTHEFSLDARFSIGPYRQVAIARAALRIFPRPTAIFLDSGSTIGTMAE